MATTTTSQPASQQFFATNDRIGYCEEAKQESEIPELAPYYKRRQLSIHLAVYQCFKLAGWLASASSRRQTK